jgi:hypothetical protein
MCSKPYQKFTIRIAVLSVSFIYSNTEIIITLLKVLERFYVYIVLRVARDCRTINIYNLVVTVVVSSILVWTYVWSMEYGVWSMEYGVWSMEYVVCSM